MNNEQVLLVDDEPSVRITLQRILNKNGYSVDLADSGESALKMCKKTNYDLVISDIKMGGMTGVDLLRHLIELDPDVAIILLTGFGSLETAIEALRLGASDYLQKPCNKDELTLRMKKCLEKNNLKRKLKEQKDLLLLAKKDLELALWKSRNAEEKLIEAHDKLEFRIKIRTEELNKAKILAESADNSKTQFLTQMSHELRTPLNAILGFAQLLELSNKEPLNQSQKLKVTHIIEGGNHLLKLIDEILDMAKIETGSVKISLERMDLCKVTDEIHALLGPLALEKGITIFNLVKYSCKPINISADSIRFKQILINLLSNAIKYNNENGEVIITSRVRGDGLVAIDIIDSGIGIPKDQLEEIFKPFTRVKAIKENIEGTGVGLALSKKLIEKMGGMLTVESAIDKGSIFSILIPQDKKSENIIDLKTDQIKLPSKTWLFEKQLKVLYVEDNIMNQKLVENIFSEFPQINLLLANEGASGVELAKTQLPDLILLDINLPGMNGVEVFKLLKSEEKTQNIPVVGISANAMQKDIEDALSKGMNSFITKPYNIPHFFDVLAEACQNH